MFFSPCFTQDSDAQERDEAVFENASQLFSWDAVAQREIKEGVMALQDRLRVSWFFVFLYVLTALQNTLKALDTIGIYTKLLLA